MRVFIPARVDEIPEKMKWLSKTTCRKLKNNGIIFGFQIQGSVKGLRTSYPFGVHLPSNLANQWQNSVVDEVASLDPQPFYAVLHGNRVSQAAKSLREKKTKYLSDVGAEDYFGAFERLVKVIKDLQDLRIPVALENTGLTNFFMSNGVWQPETYLDLKIGSLSSDMLGIKKRTGCQLLLDVEHLAFSLNFASRKHDYAHLAKELPSDISEKEKALMEEFGLFIRKGWVPVVTNPKGLGEEIKNIGASIYHISGSSGKEWLEIRDGKIDSHAPIKENDKPFREILKLILDQNPIIVPEVSGPENPCWAHRSSNAQKESFEALCQILVEEL